MKKIEPQIPEIIVSSSSMKQLSMIGKINPPFIARQVVFKKGLDMKLSAEFNDACFKTGCKLVYICREYDGSERYFLLLPIGTNLVENFPQDKNIVFLV